MVINGDLMMVNDDLMVINDGEWWWLVGGFSPTPLKNDGDLVTVGIMKFPIWWESHNPFHVSSHHQLDSQKNDIKIFCQ